MQFHIDRNNIAALVAVIALRQAGISPEWEAPHGWKEDELKDLPIRCVISGEPHPAEVRMGYGALLEMLFPAASAKHALELARERTLANIGLSLLDQLVAQPRGYLEASISSRLLNLLAEVDHSISGPVFVPEQFTYVQSECFDGQHWGHVDMVFAAIFSILEDRFPLEKLSLEKSKITVWRSAMLRLPSVKKACADMHLDSGFLKKNA